MYKTLVCTLVNDNI